MCPLVCVRALVGKNIERSGESKVEIVECRKKKCQKAEYPTKNAQHMGNHGRSWHQYASWCVPTPNPSPCKLHRGKVSPSSRLSVSQVRPFAGKSTNLKEEP